MVFDADTMPNLYPTSGGYYNGYNYGYIAKVWRWMCGPESQTEDTRKFYTLDSTDAYAYNGTTHGYQKWNRPDDFPAGQEPNNVSSNKYGQEFCLQYGYVSDGAWNDWGPEHSPQSYENRSVTGSYETSSASAPGGFIVEFSPYDINKNNKEDDGEVPTIPVEEDYTIITVEPHIVSAKLDKETFKVNEPISVTSVIGDRYSNDGVLDELITENKVPSYQWEYFDEDTNTWKNATGEGNTSKTYTPVLADYGKKLRVHITPKNNDTDNPLHYVGDLYLDATGSDDHTDKINGTPVGYDNATVEGNDFMVAKKDLPSMTSDKIIKDYSKAEATVDDINVDVKPIADDEITTLKKADTGDSVDITLVNNIINEKTDKVKATVYDKATPPAADKNGKTSQIGSNDFTILKGSTPLTIDDVVQYGKVTVLTDGENAEANYTINEKDLNKLNDAVKNGPDNTVVPVKVKDKTTGLETTVNVTIKANNILELESAKLTPFKGKDENGNLKHYYAGDTITVDEVKLAGIDVPITGKQLTDDFNYQWQYWLGNGEKDWENISGADGITLSAENTTNYAKNKVQVVITPKDSTKYNTTNVKNLYVDGNSSAKENGDGSDHTTNGTYIDIFTIDANDFVISLKDAQEITDSKAADTAGVKTEISNYSSDGTKEVVTTPTSNVKDENGLSKVTKASDVPVKFNAETTVDGKKVTAVDKESPAALGKTVTAYVKDSAKTETLDDGSKIGIGANDITITVKEAKEILNGDNATQSQKLSQEAETVVVDKDKTTKSDALKYGDGNNSVKVSYASENKLKAEKGTYPVTYTYTDADGKTVDTVAKVTVISNAEVKATDFIISIEDANKVKEDDVEKKANATGKDDDGNAVGNDKLDVDDTDMSNLKAVEKPGDLPIVISNTSASPNPKVSVTAHVVDKTGADDTGKITIGANNFDIYPEDVQKALDGGTDILKTFADAIAMDNGSAVPSNSVLVTDAYKNDLKTEPGTYPVTFTYTNSESKTVTVTVTATVKVPSIDAHDFIISTTDAKDATADIIRGKSGATGVDGDSQPVSKDKIVIDDSSIDAIKDAGDNGVSKDVPVKVTNTDKEPYPTKTVTAHIVDKTKDNKEKEKDTKKQITIGANNFFISPEDADKAKGATGDDDILKKLSEVLAIEGYKDVPFDDIKVTNKDTLDSKPGDYPITFAYKGVDVTVTATVKTPDVSKASIDAHDIIISVENSRNITENIIKDTSDASGKDAFDKPIKPSQIDVKDDDVDNIKNTTAPDMIPVELKNTTTDPNTAITINAYIVDKQKDNTDTENDLEKQISIGANNFDISVEDAAKAIDGDDSILRKLSSVVALDGGNNVDTPKIAVSDKLKLKAEPGRYPVTYSYTNSSDETVTVTVDATVKGNSGVKDPVNKDDNNKDNGDGEEIAGNDFTVEAGGDPLTPKDIIDKGNVDAVDGNGTPSVLPPDSSVDAEDLAKLNDAIKDGKKGTYPVKVTTPKGTPVTVNVTVTDKNADKKDDDVKTDETIAANNFKIGVNDYDNIFAPDNKNDNVKKLSNALAYDTDLKTPVEITKVDTTAVLREPGTYPVTLATDKGTTTTISVTIDKDWDTIGDIDKAADSNKNGETTDNETAKKVELIGNPNPVSSAVGGTSEIVNPEDIIYEKTNPQDKTEPIDPNKKVAASNALKINGVQVPDDMYSVSPDGTKLIISRDYLATLAKGTYPAVLSYSDGTEQTFNVSIVDYDEKTIVKNPPLFSMYKEIVLKKKNTFTVNLKGISEYANVTSKITGKGKKAKSIVKIKQQKNGDVLITPKKTGKTQVTCTIIQNGAEYKVVVDIKVLKQYKGTTKNFNLKTKGLVKTSGELPEFNVYKRIVKGKNTKIKFTKVATDAKVKFYVANKKEAKSLKIGKIKRKGKTATCTIVGKKKGWVHLTAEITQNGKTYYTRLLVRIDDGTWSSKQLKKYLK